MTALPKPALAWLPILLFAAATVPAQETSIQTNPNANLRLVEVENMTVTGTHLPADSIIRLSGIKVHDKVNDLIVKSACHKVTATGLVGNVEYSYDVYPDRPSVVLNLKLTDELPLLPASIKPAADESAIWACLERIDPMFLHQLPATEKALNFYANNADACLKSAGRVNEYVKADVTADSSGKLTGVVFDIRAYKNAPKK